MAVPVTAERARARYAAAVYRSALLRDPHPARAAQAVITAFSQQDWSSITLDDQLEAHLVASLPPLPRLRVGRLRPPSGLPAAFWQLPPVARLALGLRLLRGMDTATIAHAVALDLPATQNLLVDAALSLTATTPLAAECRQCWLARLDEPAAARSHWLGCSICRDTLPRWERSETELAEQLGHAVGSLPLPRDVDEALGAVLNSGPSSVPSVWRQPARLRLASIGLVVIALVALAWPRATTRPDAAPTANNGGTGPRALLQQARTGYTAIPAGDAVLHRHWSIALGLPLTTWSADEWIDQVEPARHRMQLVADKAVQEWQSGDGTGTLRYLGTDAPRFCGNVTGSEAFINNINRWELPPAAQTELRNARWQHGVWGVGLYYLGLAATAPSLRSLGVAGHGSDAALTIAAEGPTISGTLLLRLDALDHSLREVRQVVNNNGQTEDRVPWRLLTSESVERIPALSQGLMERYPSDANPPTIKRTDPILDPACPLAGVDHLRSLPELLAAVPGPLVVGLTQRPAGTQLATVASTADPIHRGPTTDIFRDDWSDVQVTYIGLGKRLMIAPAMVTDTAPFIHAGSWDIQWHTADAPTVVRAFLRPYDPHQAKPVSHQIWAEGWSQAELLPVLAMLQPLHPVDWIQARDLFYEPAPAPSSASIRDRALAAVRLQPNEIWHQFARTTVRQAPFFAELQDPYHLSAARWPAARIEEKWAEVTSTGTVGRWRWSQRDSGGHVLQEQWSDGEMSFVYDGTTNTIARHPISLFDRDPLNQQLQPLLAAQGRRWSNLADGRLLAEQALVINNLFVTGAEPWALDNWRSDLASNRGLDRLTFGPDGSYQSHASLAIIPITRPSAIGADQVPTTVPTTTLSLNTTVVERSEWLPTVAPDVFNWQPPADARPITDVTQLIQQPAAEPLQLPSVTITEAARHAQYPIWGWLNQGPESPTFAGAQAPASEIDPHTERVELERAAQQGLAVDTTWALPEGSFHLLQGSAVELRRRLQQSAPIWGKSERRTVTIRGQPQDVWLMDGADGDSNAQHWLFFELGPTLLIAECPTVEVRTTMLRLLDRLESVAQIS